MNEPWWNVILTTDIGNVGGMGDTLQEALAMMRRDCDTRIATASQAISEIAQAKELLDRVRL